MMKKKTVLKVNITCGRCKRKLIQAVSVLEGIDKIEIDSEKSTLTVTGDVDPVDVIKRTRKAGRFAEVVSIGAPAKPEPPKPDPKKLECPPFTIVPLPSVCTGCHQVEYPQTTCSIM